LGGVLLIHCLQKNIAHLLDAQHAQMFTVFVFGMKDFIALSPVL
jgi:hypothetical protein